MTQCWYRGCTNVRIALSDKLVFFNVPKEEPRRSQWIERCGRWSTHGDTTAPVRRQVCEQHFAAADIRRQFYRTTLRKNALPILWSDEDDDVEATSAALTTPKPPGGSGTQAATATTIALYVNEDRGATDSLNMDEYYYCEHLDTAEDTYDQVEQLSVEPAVAADEVDKHNEDEEGAYELQNATNADLVSPPPNHWSHSATDDENEEDVYEDVVQVVNSRCDSTTELNVPADQTALDEPMADQTDVSTVSVAEQQSQPRPETADQIIEPTTAYSCESALHRRALKRKMRQNTHAKLVQRKRQQRTRLRPTSPTIATGEPAPTAAAPAVAAASAVDPMQQKLTQEFPEDTYFALSLVGSLQRLKPQQRAMAKMNIVRYLTEMAFTDSATI